MALQSTRALNLGCCIASGVCAVLNLTECFFFCKKVGESGSPVHYSEYRQSMSYSTGVNFFSIGRRRRGLSRGRGTQKFSSVMHALYFRAFGSATQNVCEAGCNNLQDTIVWGEEGPCNIAIPTLSAKRTAKLSHTLALRRVLSKHSNCQNYLKSIFNLARGTVV